MTRATPQSRQAAATLVVGDARLGEALSEGRGGERERGEVVAVATYLDALGEMAQREVAAVIGRVDPMAASMEATVAALRRVAPHARLVLAIDAGQEPLAMRAVRLGFDDYLVEPIDGEQAEAALRGEPAEAGESDGGEAEPAGFRLHRPAESDEGGDRYGDEPPPDEALDAPADPQAAVAARDADPRPSGMDSVEAPAEGRIGAGGDPDPDRDAPGDASGGGEAEEPLGDTDLIEQLLRDPAGVRDLAVRLIRQRLGRHGARVEWSADPPDATVPGGGGSGSVARVGPEDQALGYLVSDTAPPAELAAYANWLARWLTLERHLGRLADDAMRDDLTGVANRRFFHASLGRIVERARLGRFRVTLMLYDIDDFKSYNDRYGHCAGDEILRETARLMRSVVREHDVVARIGGDEFAVIFWDAEQPRQAHSDHPHTVRRAAERFQRAICEHRFPKLAEQAPGTLTISGGLASYPWDGQTPEHLVELADRMLLESKGQGKNAFTFGPGAMRECEAADFST